MLTSGSLGISPLRRIEVSSIIVAHCDVREVNGIYVYMKGQRRGPYEKPQLEAMWKSGQIPCDAMYWHDGMSSWAVISDLLADTIAPVLPEGANNAETSAFPAV